MSDNGFGGDLYTISDESGNDFVLEHVDTIELGGIFYMAFIPAEFENDDDEADFIIFKVENEGGEDVLVAIEDDELLDDLFERFMVRIFDDDDEEEN